ncbi:MAG: YraN family protein [Candidatus Xenobia bacterium]
MKFGEWGEHAAAEALESRGYQILDRNFRTRYGEIDLVARHGQTTVFVEVKSRRRYGSVAPQEAVGFAKQVQLRRMAGQWLLANGHRGRCRFDVVAIVAPEPGRIESLQVIQNAF